MYIVQHAVRWISYSMQLVTGLVHTWFVAQLVRVSYQPCSTIAVCSTIVRFTHSCLVARIVCKAGVSTEG